MNHFERWGNPAGLIRIRVRKSERIGGPVCQLPTWGDLEFYVVSPNGIETPFTGVRSLVIHAVEGTEPITATLECLVDEIDIEAVNKTENEPSK